jgi:hypothetical protein
VKPALPEPGGRKKWLRSAITLLSADIFSYIKG